MKHFIEDLPKGRSVIGLLLVGLDVDVHNDMAGKLTENLLKFKNFHPGKLLAVL